MRNRITDYNERMTSFVLDSQTLDDFKSIITREGKSMKSLIEEFMKDYIKVHKDGNPQHLITSFSENTDFNGFPSIAIDRKNKEKWINLNTVHKKEVEKLFWHIQEYKSLLESKGFTF